MSFALKRQRKLSDDRSDACRSHEQEIFMWRMFLPLVPREEVHVGFQFWPGIGNKRWVQLKVEEEDDEFPIYLTGISACVSLTGTSCSRPPFNLPPLSLRPACIQLRHSPLPIQVFPLFAVGGFIVRQDASLEKDLHLPSASLETSVDFLIDQRSRGLTHSSQG